MITEPRSEPRPQPVEPAPRPRPPAFDALVSAVEKLASDIADPSHAGLVLTLRRLADAMDISYEDPDQASAARVREIARKLEASDRDSVTHSDLVAEAMNEALAVIERRLPDRSHSQVRASYLRAVRAAERITPKMPLLELQPQMLDAFAAVTHALLVVHGANSPFAGAQQSHERSAARFREQASVASAAVATVAATFGDPALRAAADALDAIAIALEVAPISGSLAGELDDKTVAIRFEAARLRRSGNLGFEQSDRIKAGLSRGLDALDRLAKDCPIRNAKPMLLRAREACTGIDEYGMFEFQRAAIQEALRSTVDALLILASC